MEFEYTARTKEGEIVSDTIEAPSREAVGQRLRTQGLLPTAISPKVARVLKFNLSFATLFAHVSLLERLTFINNLAVTLKAGLPVSKALYMLSKQAVNSYFRNVLAAIAHNVESGKTLSESLEAYPNVFSPLVVSLVRVGEQSGNLDQTLEYLGAQIARDYNLLRRTRGALVYPSVVVIALIIVGYLMFSFVLPRLTETFKEFNADLPFLTVIIIKTVDLFSRYSFLIFLIFLALFGFLWFGRKTLTGRTIIHRLNLGTPLIGRIVKKLNLARFTIIFSGLLRSGMPIVEALKITSNTMTNIYYKQAIAEASEKVKVGVDLVAVLEKYPKLFTPMVLQMIQVGGETGTMEKVLAEVSNFYETEVDDTVKNLSSIIEPVLVMVIGAVVGVLAVGLILPIYNIGQNL